MKLLLEIADKDLELETKDVELKPRGAARAILYKDNKVALLHVTKHNYYKLPGGGIDPGESVEQALEREIKEETGCTLSVIDEIGKIVEYRTHTAKIQTSYCFIAKVTEEGEPNFTQKELDNGFEIVWVDLDKALKLVKNGTPNTYEGKFIIVRDHCFLKQVKNNMWEKTSKKELKKLIDKGTEV